MDLAAQLRAARARQGVGLRSCASCGAREAYVRTNGSATATVLTLRQEEVLHLVAEGLLDKEIAGTLAISVNTVKTHVRVILDKLSVYNRTGAVAAARSLAILD